MTDITAIILAAGMGVRMGPRGKLHPKGLLRLGGQTLIEQSIASLRARGVHRVVLVTGHLQDQYQALLGGGDVELVHSDAYATTGSLRTLQIGLGHVDGPCVILESDLIYAPQALDPIDGTGNRLIVSGATGAGDEVWVWAEAAQGGPRHLTQMSKDRGALAAPPYGELVGITALTGAAATHMRDVAQRVLARDPEEHYEHGIVALAHETGIECVRLDDLPWAEIDDEAMLKRAERVVLPRVVRARGRAG